jgi:hypothetical protein
MPKTIKTIKTIKTTTNTPDKNENLISLTWLLVSFFVISKNDLTTATRATIRV